jgi:hypothetical protein
MRDLEILRRLLAENGLIAPERDRAGSMEIVPLFNDLIGGVPFYQDQNPQPPKQEGGGCTMCASGCSTGCTQSCQSGCPTACSNGCTACCQM